MTTQFDDNGLRSNLALLDPAAMVTVDLDAARRRIDRHISDGSSRVALESAAPRHRRIVRPVAVAAAIAAGVVAVGVASPWSGTIPQAMASWTAQPSPVSGSAASAAADDCRDLAIRTSTLPEDVQASTFDSWLAERRGNFVFTVLQSSSGWEFRCIVKDRTGIDQDAGSSPEWGLVAARDFVAPTSPSRVTTLGIIENGMRSGSQFYVTGKVGEDVQRMTIHVGGAVGDVEATVTGGRFAAWWPGTDQWHLFQDAQDPDVTIGLSDGSQIEGSMEDFVVAES